METIVAIAALIASYRFFRRYVLIVGGVDVLSFVFVVATLALVVVILLR